MPEINLKIKIKGGPRTPLEVFVDSLSVNQRVIKFQNGNEISDWDMVGWLTGYLTRQLHKIQEPLSTPVTFREKVIKNMPLKMEFKK